MSYSVETMESTMDSSDDVEEYYRQTDAELTEEADKLEQLNQRISKLSEPARTTTEEYSPEDPESNIPTSKASAFPETEPTDVDTFTHFSQKCPSRKRSRVYVDFFQPVKKCTKCYDHTSTRAPEYWEPAKHKTLLKKFPAMVTKEMRDSKSVQSQPAGPNGERYLYGHNPGNPNDTLYSSEESEEVEANDAYGGTGVDAGEISGQDEINSGISNDGHAETNDNDVEGYLPLLPMAHIHHTQPQKSRIMIVIPDTSSDGHLTPTQTPQPHVSPDSSSRIVIEIPDTSSDVGASTEDEEMEEKRGTQDAGPFKNTDQDDHRSVSGNFASAQGDTDSATDRRNAHASPLLPATPTATRAKLDLVLLRANTISTTEAPAKAPLDVALTTAIVSADSILDRAYEWHNGRLIKADRE